MERGSRLCRAALRPAAKLAEDSDTTTSLFYLIEVLMNGETETASLAQEKNKSLRDTRPELDEIVASTEHL